jgi:hypothetical protein
VVPWELSLPTHAASSMGFVCSCEGFLLNRATLELPLTPALSPAYRGEAAEKPDLIRPGEVT